MLIASAVCTQICDQVFVAAQLGRWLQPVEAFAFYPRATSRQAIARVKLLHRPGRAPVMASAAKPRNTTPDPRTIHTSCWR